MEDADPSQLTCLVDQLHLSRGVCLSLSCIKYILGVLLLDINCNKGHREVSRKDRTNAVRGSCLTFSMNTIHQVCSWSKFTPSFLQKSHKDSLFNCTQLQRPSLFPTSADTLWCQWMAEEIRQATFHSHLSPGGVTTARSAVRVVHFGAPAYIWSARYALHHMLQHVTAVRADLY